MLLLNEGKLLFDGAPARSDGARRRPRVPRHRHRGPAPAGPGRRAVDRGCHRRRHPGRGDPRGDRAGPRRAARASCRRRRRRPGQPDPAALRGRVHRRAGRRPGRTLAPRRGACRASSRPTGRSSRRTGSPSASATSPPPTASPSRSRAARSSACSGPTAPASRRPSSMLCGLLKPTEGEGRVAGLDLRRDTAEARGHLGYMAQKFSLYGDLTVGQNLEFFAGAYGLSGRRKRDAGRAHGRDLRPRATRRRRGQGAAARLQAAAGAGLRGDARAAGAVPRRAHLRRRPDHAARILGPHPRPGREGRHGAGHHPLHGRGGVLRPHLAGLPRPLHRARLAGRAQGARGQRRAARADHGGRLHRPGRRVRGRRGGGRSERARTADAPRCAPWCARRRARSSAIRAASSSPSCCRWCCCSCSATACRSTPRARASGWSVETGGPEAQELAASFEASRYFETRRGARPARLRGGAGPRPHQGHRRHPGPLRRRPAPARGPAAHPGHRRRLRAEHRQPGHGLRAGRGRELGRAARGREQAAGAGRWCSSASGSTRS